MKRIYIRLSCAYAMLRFKGALIPFVWRYSKSKDAWERKEVYVSPHWFGSAKDFPWYFEGEPTVIVESLNDLCIFLQRCRYVSDFDLFHQKEYWQHPKTFEQIRMGDCEDSALWTWRKLIELGYEAELFTGKWNSLEQSGYHTWVVFYKDGLRYLFETVNKNYDSMIRPLEDVKTEYIPHYSVDRAFRTHMYVGRILTSLSEWEEKNKSKSLIVEEGIHREKSV